VPQGAYYIIKRVWDWYKGMYRKWLVVKVDKPHPSIAKGFRAVTFKKYPSLSLSELVHWRCVDERLASLEGKFLGEGEFEKLMREYIHRCSKDKESLDRRLRKLELLLKAQVIKPEREKKEYPLSVYYERPEDMYLVAKRAKEEYRLGGWVYVYVFKRRFCIASLKRGIAFYLPLDSDEVSVEASRNLDSDSVELLGKAVRAIDSMLKDSHDGDETLKTVREVTAYTLMLHEMFK